jgi:hypothetical protein
MTTMMIIMTMMITEAIMTNGPIDRKLVQKVKTQTEQNERLMGRTIFTALATCGTIVGWMLLSNPTPLAPQTAVAAEAPTLMPTGVPPTVLQPTAALVAIDYAPIPTLQTLPTQPPLPTLRVYKKPAAAVNSAPVQSVDQPVPTTPPDTTAPAPTIVVDALPVLRVIVAPTVAPVVTAPQPGNPAPSNPAPPPGGGGSTGGSK